jgi:hypothetical protein
MFIAGDAIKREFMLPAFTHIKKKKKIIIKKDRR